MPVNNVLPLYIAKSLEELNKKADENKVTSNNINLLCKSAGNLFQSAERLRKEGDEEKSYILYLRYYQLCQNIKSHKDYKNNKKFFDDMLGIRNLLTAADWSEKLSTSLDERYDLLKEEENAKLKIQQLQEEEERQQLLKEASGVKKLGPLTITKEKIPLEIISKTAQADDGGFVMCQKLYLHLMDPSKKIVIMDTRSSDDYKASRIKHPCCISVPQDILIPGSSAHIVQKNLPVDSLALWKQRAEMDIVVLIDWNSPESKEEPIQILKSAITLWEAENILKAKPVILNGGYSTWLITYPVMTTNPHISVPKFNETSTESYLSNFDYPMDSLEEDLNKGFLNDPDESSPLNSRNSDVNSSANNNSFTNRTTNSADRKSVTGAVVNAITVDRSTKPKNVNIDTKPSNINVEMKPRNLHIESKDNKNINGFNKSLEKDVDKPKFDTSISNKLERPSYNRMLKPSNLSSNEASKNKLEEGLSKEYKVADDGIKLQEERLRKEKYLEELSLRKSQEAEEEMRRITQEQMDETQKKIVELQNKLKDNDEEKNSLRSENERMKNELKELNEYAKWKQELEIAESEKKRKNLDAEVERLRKERKQKEQLIAEKKNVETNSSNDNNSPQVKQVVPETNLSNLSTPTHTPSKGNSSSGISYARLNSGGSSSNDQSLKSRLSRSHSSPNIAELGLDTSDAQSMTINSSNNMSYISNIPSINRQTKPTSGFENQNEWICRRGIAGLKNMGNTCYMNSVLQCLASTNLLAKYFLNRCYKKNNLRIKGELVEAFTTVIRELSLAQSKVYNPRDFKTVISRYCSRFTGHEQQDSQEFLIVLLDNLHESLNMNAGRRKESLNEDENLPDDVAAQKAWAVFKQQNDSILVDLFHGQFKSTVQCMECGKKSTTFDAFTMLQLPIPEEGLGNSYSLKQCLKLFLSEERISGDSRWKCPRCNEYRVAKKKIDIYRLPTILVIHLKRFYYETIWRKKLQNYIDFPLTDLDLRDSVAGPNGTTKYELFAVSNHYGTLEGGHYTAYCKIDESWYKFDDHEVYRINSKHVKSAAGYILFYTSVGQ